MTSPTTVPGARDRMAPERRLGRVGRVGVFTVFVIGLIGSTVDPFTMLFYLSYAVVGVILTVRRPENVVSWLVLALAFWFVTTSARPEFDWPALQRGTAPAWQTILAWLAAWSGNLSFVAYLALTLVFPSGRLPAGRWRPLAIGLVSAALILAVVPAFAPTIQVAFDATTEIVVPNPVGVLPAHPIWSVLSVAIMPLLVVGLVSMLVRYRRSHGQERLQLRWLVATIAFVALAVSGAFVVLATFGEQVGDLVWLPALIAYPTVPIAIAVAILRYRLYAIDRIISRTISWAAVSAVVIAGFLGVLIAFQAILAGLTQGRSLAIALSTLAAFALLQPVRARVQRLVDRHFDRARIDAQHTAERFAERLRDEVDLLAIGAELQRTVDQGLRPRTVGLWVRDRDGRVVKTP